MDEEPKTKSDDEEARKRISELSRNVFSTEENPDIIEIEPLDDDPLENVKSRTYLAPSHVEEYRHDYNRTIYNLQDEINSLRRKHDDLMDHYNQILAER